MTLNVSAWSPSGRSVVHRTFGCHGVEQVVQIWRDIDLVALCIGPRGRSSSMTTSSSKLSPQTDRQTDRQTVIGDRCGVVRPR